MLRISNVADCRTQFSFNRTMVVMILLGMAPKKNIASKKKKPLVLELPEHENSLITQGSYDLNKRPDFTN